MQHLATYRGGIRHMTPEIRRGDIRTGRHGENRVQRRRYCGVIRQRHRQRRFISAYYPDQR